MQASPISVLGAGAWGTGLAVNAAQHGEAGRVILWGRSADHVASLQQARCNTAYLPHVPLPSSLNLTADFSAAVQHAAFNPQGRAQPGLIVIATPSAALGEIFTQLVHTLAELRKLRSEPEKSVALPHVVWLCKGLMHTSNGASSASPLLPSTPSLPSEFVAGLQNKLASSDDPHTAAAALALQTGVLSGPSFAKEVGLGQPSALVAASSSEAVRLAMVQAFHNPTLRVYSSTDVIGVEIGGAVKNVLAIAAGLCDGLALGHNARAALITRGLTEMTRLGAALGAQTATMMGLSGLGDLVLTTTGDLSRNRQVGLQLAKGLSLPEVLQQLGHVAEGVSAAPKVLARAVQAGVEMPITHTVVALLDGRISPQEAVSQLMGREAKAEV